MSVNNAWKGSSLVTLVSILCSDSHLYIPRPERLYQIEHPRLVSLFDEVSAVDENEPAYWISTKWLKGAYKRLMS